MRTNAEKWDYYINLINTKEKEFIEANTENIPDRLYKVYLSGEMRVLNVCEVYYMNRLYKDEKVTRVDVAEVKGYYENIDVLDVDNIRIGWEYFEGSSRHSSAVKYSELNNGYFTNKEEAKLKVKELLDIKEKENELLENGHIRCTYCSKVIPENEAISSEIIFQSSRPDPSSRSGYKRFVDRRTNKYCSGKCAGYDQMAHEG